MPQCVSEVGLCKMFYIKLLTLDDMILLPRSEWFFESDGVWSGFEGGCLHPFLFFRFQLNNVTREMFGDFTAINITSDLVNLVCIKWLTVCFLRSDLTFIRLSASNLKGWGTVGATTSFAGTPCNGKKVKHAHKQSSQWMPVIKLNILTKAQDAKSSRILTDHQQFCKTRGGHFTQRA